MQKIIKKEKLDFIDLDNIAETFLSEDVVDASLVTAVFGFVFKEDKMLHVELSKKSRGEIVLDIPGGHVEKGEDLQSACIREVFEETGVLVDTRKQIAFIKISVLEEKPKDYKYPYPYTYMVFYLCNLVKEEDFTPTSESLGKKWLDFKEAENSFFLKNNKELFLEILEKYK